MWSADVTATILVRVFSRFCFATATSAALIPLLDTAAVTAALGSPSFSAVSITDFTPSMDCAPEIGYFLPESLTTIVHGVPLPPVAPALPTLSDIACVYLPEAKHLSKSFVFIPDDLAILERTGSNVCTFGVPL